MQVQEEARKIISERGLDKVSLPQLTEEVTAFARRNVPTEVKQEILECMKQFIEKESGMEF